MKKPNLPWLIIGVCLVLCAGVFLAWVWPSQTVTLEIGLFSGSNWDVSNPNTFNIIDAAIARFQERYPQVKVHYYGGIPKDDYSEWLAQQFLKGRSPDVFFVLSDDFEVLGTAGMLKNLDRLMQGDPAFDSDRFYSTALNAGQFEGLQYALPYEVVPTLMFVNKTLLQNEQIPTPSANWTWDDLMDICRKVTRDTNGDHVIDQFGTYNYNWEHAMYSNDGQLFDRKGQHATVSNSNVTDAVRFARRLLELNQGQKVTQDDFDIGKVAFMPMRFSDYRTYKMYPYKTIKYSDFQWDCITLPAGPDGGNVSQVSSLLMAISSQTRHEEMAWEFLKTMVYDESIQFLLFQYSQGASVLRNVTNSHAAEQMMQADSDDSEYAINSQLLNSVIESGVNTPNFPKYTQAFTLIKSEIDTVIENQQEIDSTFKILEHNLDRFLQQ